jgi:hypothetical protein
MILASCIYSNQIRVRNKLIPTVKAAKTARWAVTMTKVRIRRVLSRTRWQLVTFCGARASESVGIVDLMAVRKDFRKPKDSATKRGDARYIILIQVKGGSSRNSTSHDYERMAVVARQLHARRILLATWKNGSAAEFHTFDPYATRRAEQWT